MNNPKILVVEDDPAIRRLICTALELLGYPYRAEQSGAAALAQAANWHPDAVVLDMTLPDADGVDIIRHLRAEGNTPIVVVSARTESRDKVAALDAGADDYLTKPFAIKEFMACLNDILKAERSNGSPPTAYTNGALTINRETKRVCAGTQELSLTACEYQLLELLARNTGRVITNDCLLRALFGDAQPTDVPALRVSMATLQKKLNNALDGDAYIRSHLGVGYQLVRHYSNEKK